MSQERLNNDDNKKSYKKSDIIASIITISIVVLIVIGITVATLRNSNWANAPLSQLAAWDLPAVRGGKKQITFGAFGLILILLLSINLTDNVKGFAF